MVFLLIFGPWAQGTLLKFLPDIYIHTDHFTGPKSGKSPGFGLTLYAETTTGKRGSFIFALSLIIKK